MSATTSNPFVLDTNISALLPEYQPWDGRPEMGAADARRIQGQTHVHCYANRGVYYHVLFDREGNPSKVSVVYRRGSDTGRVTRQLWASYGKSFRTSLAANCAIRAALRVAAERAGALTRADGPR